MSIKRTSWLAAVLAVVGVGVSGAIADLSVPVTFDCSVFARITNGTVWPVEVTEQYGTNSASVAYYSSHADIAFTSGMSAGSLYAFTQSSLDVIDEVGTLTPSTVVIGTTPELPAGTPLTLSVQAAYGNNAILPDFSLDVYRGTTNLVHITEGDLPPGTPSVTKSASVVAGETLEVAYFQNCRSTVMNATFTATGVPVPAACCVGYACSLLTPAACASAGGNYKGVGSSCGSGACSCGGDVNCDSQVSFADINPFVQALGDLSAWQAAYPTCPWQNCDVNGDGVVSFADINPFVAKLGSPGPCQ